MGLPMGLGSGRERTVFVYEHVTGGGLIGQELPPSWATEGAAMRRVIARDFAAVPGVRVVTTVDVRLANETDDALDVRIVADRDGGWFEALAEQADYTLAIAPETEGILSRLAGVLERPGNRSLGSGRRAINLVGDKARLAHHFLGLNISTPPTWTLRRNFSGLPTEWDGLILIKPRRGAGSIDTAILKDRRLPLGIKLDGSFIAQPFLEGEPMSASLIVDAGGGRTLLAVGHQRITVDFDGMVSYRGGTIPARSQCGLDDIDAAIRSVQSVVPMPGLRGFVGIDFLLDEHGRATVLEINPRPTTSYVGLVQIFPPGMIAGAWLDAIDGPLELTPWPGRIREAMEYARPISFDADGSIHL